MKLNNPLPQSLPKECSKAARILQSFVNSKNEGLDGVIPRIVLENAKAFAIFTVVKAGFIVTARAGSGIVIARVEDGTWSAPSAIGTAGLGVGGQVGAEMTDFLIVLNTSAAIRSFMTSGSLTLGGSMSVALGPLGRTSEALGSVNTNGKLAAIYTYSKTRGIFGGVSLEGSVIVERQDANAQAYNSPVTVGMLLGGRVPVPEWAQPLIATLDACASGSRVRKWVDDRAAAQRNQGMDSTGELGYSFSGQGSSNARSVTRSQSFVSTPSFMKRKKEQSVFPPPSWGNPKESGSYFGPAEPEDTLSRPRPTSTQSAGIESRFPSDLGSGVYTASTTSKRQSMPAAPHSTSHSKSPIDDLLNSPNEFDFSKSSWNQSSPLGTQFRSQSQSISFTPTTGITNSDHPAGNIFHGIGSESGLGPIHLPIGDKINPTNQQPRDNNPAGASSSFDASSVSPFSPKPNPFTSTTSLPSSLHHGTQNHHQRSLTSLQQSSQQPTHNRQRSRVVDSNNLLDLDDLDKLSLQSSSSSLSNKRLSTKPEFARPLGMGGIGRAVALYDFDAVESGDLSFTRGAVITITKKSDSVNDWWTGRLNGKEGVFPANFVELA